MTPKQKAIELVDKYQYVENKYKEYLTYEQCKQCALIAVDEMINSCAFLDYKNKKYDEVSCDYPDYHFVNYWNEVKTEIEKL